MIPLCTGEERLKTGAGDKAHPTQKPEALLHRVLLASSRPGDMVLDPFFGTGTTGAVAKRLGRRFIGIEREAGLRRRGRARIAAVRPLDDEATAPTRRSAPSRASLSASSSRRAAGARRGAALAQGRRAGADPRRRQADRGDLRGSIHKVGAALEGAPSCNGWTYWHFKTDGLSVPIDVLRQQVRAEMGDTAQSSSVGQVGRTSGADGVRSRTLQSTSAAQSAKLCQRTSGKSLRNAAISAS